jgi:hypothetical protein
MKLRTALSVGVVVASMAASAMAAARRPRSWRVSSGSSTDATWGQGGVEVGTVCGLDAAIEFLT